MNTMLAQRLPTSLLSKAHRAGLAASTLVAVLGVFGAGAARAQASAVIPAVGNAASADTMNSLLGRIAPAVTPSAPPKITVERAHVADSERALAGNHGLDAYGRPLSHMGGVTYRWWVTRGASNFGVGFGTFGYVVPSPEAGGPQTLAYGSSVLMVGYRLQVNPRSTLFADAFGARRFDADTTDRISTKVGVEWKARSNKFGLDGASRSLAFQLDSGYRMSLKVRRNGIGVYVKGQF
ncbi:hypothetical protein [Rhizobacter sp. Root1221]|uniref:hypothetical protein n=1 Tax=Rhizobacter sp. Root1221 TaxID=1736433 RepID=UPI000714B38B|nr:hypothetical protein [Rhizobacter sp. Root1221]KQV91659.1 hypothetical protein ASC87_06135 [Rhizobacter sp. Root1221]